MRSFALSLSLTKDIHPPVSGIARKRDLWWQFTVRAVESRYRGSYLGILWAILNPLLMLAIYFAVFGIIFRGHFRASQGRVGNRLCDGHVSRGSRCTC